MEFKARLTGYNYSPLDEKNHITFTLDDDVSNYLDEFIDKELNITVKEYKKKRSLNANAYLWSLCNELGNKLKLSKDEVYFNLLKSYGQSEIISVVSNVSIKDYVKYYEEIGKGEINSKEFTHYKIFKGSSEYDTYEMSILIDGAIQECKQLGIQVLSDSEIDLLKREWGS